MGPFSYAEYEAPQLRVIDDATWNAAQVIKLKRSHLGAPQSRAPRRPLSGLLRCGSCGGGMVSIGNHKRTARLQCGTHKESGSCTNSRKVNRDAIEAAVFAGLKDELANPIAGEFKSLGGCHMSVDTYFPQRQILARLSARGVKSAPILPSVWSITFPHERRWKRPTICISTEPRLGDERPRGGRPQIETKLRALIRRMSVENPLWGAPRIHGELLKLGIEVAQSSVAKYMVKRRAPPSQGWRTFLRNHAPDIAAMDLFVVPTIGFDLLYAFVIVRLDRRDLVWINVTANPTAEWVARQITEAFPWDEAPHYLIRDRDRIYGSVVTRRLRAMGIRDKPTAPASPWQNGFAERLIGSIRRECVDHIIVLDEMHLRRVLKSYADYYNCVRTHRSLNKDAPVSRPVQRTGVISSRAILGGLHHRYARV